MAERAERSAALQDYCDEAGAKKLADRLRQYWIGKGYPNIRTGIVRVRAVKPGRPGNKPVFAVVSNLENGFPPKEL